MASKGDIAQALRSFEIAVRTDEMKGSQHPLDHDWITAQYRYFKLHLEFLLHLETYNKKSAARLEKYRIAMLAKPTDEDHDEWERREEDVLRRHRKDR